MLNELASGWRRCTEEEEVEKTHFGRGRQHAVQFGQSEKEEGQEGKGKEEAGIED